ncbi:MAG: hypothetical protein R3F11_01395 [Verrucomicrobiales bacterium]
MTPSSENLLSAGEEQGQGGDQVEERHFLGRRRFGEPRVCLVDHEGGDAHGEGEAHGGKTREQPEDDERGAADFRADGAIQAPLRSDAKRVSPLVDILGHFLQLAPAVADEHERSGEAEDEETEASGWSVIAGAEEESFHNKWACGALRFRIEWCAVGLWLL